MNDISAPAISNMTNDELILSWKDIKNSLDKAKNFEMEMRKEIIKRIFPEAKEGTNTHELGAGYKLKAVKKFSYKLNQDKAREVYNEMVAVSNEASFIAERLFKHKVELAVSEYKELPDNLKAIVNKAVTIEDAAPSLELVEPKK